MDLNEILNELKLSDKDLIKNENGSYTIELKNSNEYSKYYTILDKSEIFEEDDEASQINGMTSSIQYINDEEDIVITLLGDLENDTYKIIIRELD